jgi:hypothetical protein
MDTANKMTFEADSSKVGISPQSPDLETLSLPKPIATVVQFKNIDGKMAEISVDSLRRSLPGSPRYGTDQEKLIESGWLIIDNRGNEMLITKTGFIFGFLGPRSEYDDYREIPLKLKLDEHGMPIAQDGSEISPRARLIVVGEGTFACAPPHLELVNREPRSGMGNAIAELYAQVFTPTVAECEVTMRGTCYLGYAGPAPCGFADDGIYSEAVKVSVNRLGAVHLNARSRIDRDERVFPWEQNLETYSTTSDKNFRKITNS